MSKFTTIAVSCVAAFAASGALAGTVQPFPVEVDTTNRIANGDLVTARYSAFENDFIGCGVRKFDDGVGGATAFGFCQAEDRKGNRAFCNTSNEDLLDVIEASGDYGFVTFSWNEDTECIRIGFSNQSFYLPKGLGSNE